MNALETISKLNSASNNITNVDLDISPSLSKDEQLMMTVMLMSLGFNVTIQQTERFSTHIKGERA